MHLYTYKKRMTSFLQFTFVKEAKKMCRKCIELSDEYLE